MKTLGLSVCLVLVAMVSGADQTPVRFRYWKPIDRAAAKEEEIVAFNLDSDIYAATRPGYPDLRVIDEAMAEAPYQIEPDLEHREERTRQSFSTELVKARPDGNALEVQLRLPDKSPSAEGFTFTTPLTNYERKVLVSGSADGVKWEPLVTDGIIFDYSRFMDVRSRDIALPKNSYRQFKITIQDVTDDKESPFTELARTFRGAKEDQRVERTTIERRPFRIDRIDAWHVTIQDRVQQARTAAYPIAGFESKEDPAKKQTTITVRTRREPLIRFTMETPSRNFSRRAGIEVPVARGVNTEWHSIGEATVSNFSFRDQRREQLTIGFHAFHEHREEQYRIVISNEDNPPLNVTGVKAEGNVYRVVFLAQPNKTYRVHYGSESGQAPKYEAATVLATLRKDYAPVAATLGAQAENTEFGGEGLGMRGLLNNWIFLGCAIGLMVVVLGWALFRAGKRLEGLPGE